MTESSRILFREYRKSPDSAGRQAQSDGTEGSGSRKRAEKWAPIREYFRWVWPYRYAVALVLTGAMDGERGDATWCQVGFEDRSGERERAKAEGSASDPRVYV